MFKRKPKELTPYEMAVLNVQDAATNLRHAQANFNNASPDYFEVANTELTAARHKFDAALREAKALQPKDDETKKSRNPFVKPKRKDVVNPQGNLNFEIPEETFI